MLLLRYYIIYLYVTITCLLQIYERIYVEKILLFLSWDGSYLLCAYYATEWIFKVIARKRAAILKISYYSFTVTKIIVKTIFQSPWFQFYDSSSEYQCPVDLLIGDKYFTRTGTSLFSCKRRFVHSIFRCYGILPFQLLQKAEISLSRFLFILSISYLRQIKWRAFINVMNATVNRRGWSKWWKCNFDFC